MPPKAVKFARTLPEPITTNSRPSIVNVLKNIDKINQVRNVVTENQNIDKKI